MSGCGNCSSLGWSGNLRPQRLMGKNPGRSRKRAKEPLIWVHCFSGCTPREQNLALVHSLLLSTLWSSRSGHRLVLCPGSSFQGTTEPQGYVCLSLSASRCSAWRSPLSPSGRSLPFSIRVFPASGKRSDNGGSDRVRGNNGRQRQFRSLRAGVLSGNRRG